VARTSCAGFADAPVMPREWRLSLDYPTLGTTRGWAAAAELAARQHGVVALGQLVALGIPPATVRSWVATHRLIRLYRGVFAVGHRHLRAEGRYLAGVLACGPGAVLSHLTAAALWEIRRSAAALLDVTVPGRTGRKQRRLRVHDASQLPADEITEKDAVPCTTVARTLLDLAAVLPQRGIEAAVETSERLELLDLRSVTILLARHRGRRGTARLRRALAGFDAEVLRARSETEARFFHLCVDSGIPRPLVNRLVEGGGQRYEVDFHWPAARSIVETDSPHHDTIAARRRDFVRDAALRRAGWKVIRCRWHHVVLDPAPLVETVRRSLG
jgi:predicted transcriptional regulator of viral defense system